jgi:hypothetical protein
MRRRLFSIILLLAIPLLGVVVSTPASAQTAATIEITSVSLVARGAAIDVALTVTCEEGFVGFVGAEATQRSGNRIAQGFGNEDFVCTGQPQTLIVRAVSFVGSAPFKSGIALVTASLQACDADFSVCQFATIQDEVFRIRA